MNNPNFMDEKPQPVDTSSYPPPKSGSSGKDRLIQLILVLAVSAVVCFIFINFLFPSVSKKDFDSNFQNVATDIKNLQSSLTMNPDLSQRLAKVESSVAAYATKAQLDEVSKKVTDINTSTFVKQSDLQAVKDSISALKTSSTSTTPADSAVIKELQEKVNLLTTDSATQAKQISDLQTKTNSIPTPTATPTGTPTPTPTNTSNNPLASSTYGVVTASLQTSSMSWNGSPIMSMTVQPPSYGTITSVQVTNGGSGYTSPPMVVIAAPTATGGSVATAQATVTGGSVTGVSITNVGSGYTTSPTITISGGGGNGAIANVVSFNPMQAFSTTSSIQLNLSSSGVSNVVANNIQLALGLAVVDGNGNPLGTTLPWITPGVNLTVSSNNFGSSWQYQSVVSPNTYVFNSASASSLFYQGISLQPKQQNSITLYVTLTNSSPNVVQSVSFYPLIKVLSYTPN